MSRRVAIVSQRLLGHVIPALGVGVELSNRGYEVTVLGHRTNRHLIEGAGLRFTEVGWDKIPYTYLSQYMDQLFPQLERLGCDLIMTDSAQCVPAYSAEILGIPWVSFQTTVPLPDHMIPGGITVNQRLRTQYREQLNQLRISRNLPPLEDERRTRGDLSGISPFGHFIMVYPELVGDDLSLPPSSILVGMCSYTQLDALSVPARQAHSPTILVSTSSVPRIDYREISNRYVNAVIKAFQDTDCRVAVTAHTAAGRDLPSHVSWTTEYPNHHILMPAADILVTHGGSGTIQNALQQGLPMAIVPLGEEHEYVAARCVELGVAIRISPDELSTNHVFSISTRLMNDTSYKKRARAISQHIADLPSGNQACADYVDDMFNEGN